MQRSYKNNPNLFHDSARHTKMLGCPNCPDFRLCGGLAVKQPILNCIEYCKCETPDERSKCTHVCPNGVANFANRGREVHGYDLNLPAARDIEVPLLPRMIPIFKDAARRKQVLELPAIAVRLDRILSLKTGTLLVQNRQALLKRFLLANETRIVINGIGFDEPLEYYWSIARSMGICDQLRELKPDLITTPNFSLVTDLPRQSDFHSMKRIAICWHELATAGHAAALHINGRTDRDYDRWLAFLNDHSEIRIVAFEFTSGARGKRGNWHKKQLLDLCQACTHPLSLVYRGQVKFAYEFSRSFRQVSVLYAKPYTATLNRQLLEFQKGKPLSWTTNVIPKGYPVDELFAKNVTTARRYIDANFEGKQESSAESNYSAV